MEALSTEEVPQDVVSEFHEELEAYIEQLIRQLKAEAEKEA